MDAVIQLKETTQVKEKSNKTDITMRKMTAETPHIFQNSENPDVMEPPEENNSKNSFRDEERQSSYNDDLYK